jgi:hypothetical protein
MHRSHVGLARRGCPGEDRRSCSGVARSGRKRDGLVVNGSAHPCRLRRNGSASRHDRKWAGRRRGVRDPITCGRSSGSGQLAKQ